MTYMQIALKQLGVAEDAHSVLQGLQTDLRPAQKEVFKLSISYPNYLAFAHKLAPLFSSAWSFLELPSKWVSADVKREYCYKSI